MPKDPLAQSSLWRDRVKKKKKKKAKLEDKQSKNVVG